MFIYMYMCLHTCIFNNTTLNNSDFKANTVFFTFQILSYYMLGVRL